MRRVVGRAMVLAVSLCGLWAAQPAATRTPSAAMAAAPALPPGLNFGLGNDPGDLSWMTGSGVPWKFRYAYLSAGVNTGNGWETWNTPAGQYATYYMQASQANGYIPVFSYYELLQSNPSTGSDEASRDYSNLNNSSTMNTYYANFTLLLQKAHAFGGQVIVHVEPDLWGYLEQMAGTASPSTLTASVASSGNADVAGIPNTAQGFAWALLKLRDQYAPNVELAIHASLWATRRDVASDTDPTLDVSALADQTAAYLNASGISSNPYGSTWDLVFNDVADHDAAWYGDTSHWWDRTNVTVPNFTRWLTYMARLHADTNRPLVAWQVPVGNQYFLTMNNTPGHYQDNRAEYFLAHPADLQAAGIGAVLFGKANANQTNYTDDTGDGITNNNGQPTSGYQCSACNTHVAQYADDDGGYLRIFVGQYYRCAGPSSTTPAPAAGSTPTFYFAEGFTGPGFTETLSLFMPNQGGTALIDYFTAAGHLPTVSVPLTAGQVTVEDVNKDVGCNQQVSARVTLPAAGVVERSLHFNFGSWDGSTDVVGASAPAAEWDFAEGSTLPFFSEYLSLQNPNASAVTATLKYFTDGGAHPVKTLTLPANSRTTVTVFTGDPSSNVSGCVANGAGANCGVGPGIGGVSTQVLSSAPIVVERPFYVNGFSFGSGPIRDGHDAFGANAAATSWSFAEGTTLTGFDEYLTLQNANAAVANTTLRYQDEAGNVISKPLAIPAQSRFTVPVFQAAYGVGPGYQGISVQVTSDQPIVAERPMYMVRDFGTGPVAGAHDVVGATSLGKLFGFAAASSVTGDADYLTIQNPSPGASVTITYYTATGQVARTISVAATSRRTVVVNDGSAGSGGLGPGYANVGIVVSSDQPILVEKPTYSSNPATYGAADTLGFAPATTF